MIRSNVTDASKQAALDRHTAEARESMQKYLEGLARISARHQANGNGALHLAADATPASDGPNCDVCNNMRYVVDEHGKAKPCGACGVAAKWAAHTLDKYSSVIGSELQTFDKFDTTVDKKVHPALMKCRMAAQSFAVNPTGWLVIYGQPGNGKSHLCAAVANQLIDEGQPAIFITMPDLFASLKALFDRQNVEAEGETYANRLRHYQDAPVLIADDVGAEHATPWSQSLMFELFNARYRLKLPTMFTMNYKPDDGARFDRRLIDRWHDVNFCRLVENNAPSRRRMEQR